MNKTMKAIALLGFLGLSSATITTAQAHPHWILPSHFSVSKEGGDWLTFDVTASHGTFVFDKPLGAEKVQIVMPDGRTERPNFVLRGKRRSVFDFYFVEEGTHKVMQSSAVDYFSAYKVGKRDTLKRVRADKIERTKLIPEQARDVTTILRHSRIESYVNVGKPSDKALQINGKYLEVMPLTHPSDIVENEALTLQFFFNGQPQQGVTAEIVRDGTLYRNQQEKIDVVSDQQGKVTFTPAVAGRYLLKANYKGALENNLQADQVSVNYNLTFEAQLN